MCGPRVSQTNPRPAAAPAGDATKAPGPQKAGVAKPKAAGGDGAKAGGAEGGPKAKGGAKKAGEGAAGSKGAGGAGGAKAGGAAPAAAMLLPFGASAAVAGMIAQSRLGAGGGAKEPVARRMGAAPFGPVDVGVRDFLAVAERDAVLGRHPVLWRVAGDALR